MIVEKGKRGLTIRAPAKINLFLHIGDKREDGFHALESLVVFAEAGDRLTFASAESLSLGMTGPFADALDSDCQNLVLTAARALEGKLGAAITLEKNLPVAAGLGGGSADAAAALRALNVFWGLERGEAELLQSAAALGSDVPACLLSRPLWMEGRGERVTKASPLPLLVLLLVNPGIEVPTADVFAALDRRSGIGEIKPPPSSIRSLRDVVAYLEDAQNDLETPACGIAPVIDEVLAALRDQPGCVLARMTGSGASCFAIFEGRHLALPAAENLAHAHPHWWVRATRLASPDIGVPHWTRS